VERNDFDYLSHDAPCADAPSEAELVEQIKDLIATAYLVIDDIRANGASPYLKALEHCLKHVANGGTIRSFKPLVRTTDYAGLDRRQPQPQDSVH
jgi:hypothetical protein